jgi:hypothetical protein
LISGPFEGLACGPQYIQLVLLCVYFGGRCRKLGHCPDYPFPYHQQINDDTKGRKATYNWCAASWALSATFLLMDIGNVDLMDYGRWGVNDGKYE